MLTFEPFIMFVLFIILLFGIQAPSHLPHLQDVTPIWFIATSLQHVPFVAFELLP
jgi:hypothetical protein